MKTLISILVLLLSCKVFADVKISDYKNYTVTKINFQLEEISTGLNYPWGMTFIDDENLLITEKGGRLLKKSGMTLFQKPYQPSTEDLHKNGRHFPPNFLHKTWIDHLYWDVVLEP